LIGAADVGLQASTAAITTDAVSPIGEALFQRAKYERFI
jgi:hypothetical protein